MTHPPRAGEPVWDLARLFPDQGAWSESDYLALDRMSKQMVEYTDGFVEVLPVPTWKHQQIALFLIRAILAYAEPLKLGKAVVAPVPVRLRSKKWREPDIVFLLTANLPKGDYPESADLVIEVVSDDDRSQQRDKVEKVADYAAAGIPEYWIVDPREEQIVVLKLVDGKYVEHGKFKPGARASSVLLKGLEIDVSAALNAN